jgi:hypothetical protein
MGWGWQLLVQMSRKVIRSNIAKISQKKRGLILIFTIKVEGMGLYMCAHMVRCAVALT